MSNGRKTQVLVRFVHLLLTCTYAFITLDELEGYSYKSQECVNLTRFTSGLLHTSRSSADIAIIIIAKAKKGKVLRE